MDTTIYLLEIYPQSINITTEDGWHPLHLLCHKIHEDNENKGVEIVEFLMKHDKCAVPTPNKYGNLPLHLACIHGYLVLVKPLFNAHPEVILLENNSGDTPLDLAISCNWNEAVVQYLMAQLQFRNQALDDQEFDKNNKWLWLPIHRALQDRVASIGAIKLMITSYPASVTVADNQRCIPLHLACRYGHLIVKYLVDQDKMIRTKLSYHS